MHNVLRVTFRSCNATYDLLYSIVVQVLYYSFKNKTV